MITDCTLNIECAASLIRLDITNHLSTLWDERGAHAARTEADALDNWWVTTKAHAVVTLWCSLFRIAVTTVADNLWTHVSVD